MAGYIGNKAVGLNVTTGDILGDVGVGGDVTVGDDLSLTSDSAVLNIGADNDLKITHDGTNGDFESAGNLTFDVAGDIILDADGGDILIKDGGTTVGSIGARAGVASYIVLDPRSSGSGLTGVGTVIRPADEAGAEVDNSVSLGSSGARFKDLYLSGGVFLGGTVAANKLSDYEIGTWTPTASSGGSISVSRAIYTKIGRLVTAYAYVTITPTNNTSRFQIAGLPFTSSNLAHYYGGGSGPSYSGGLNTTTWGSPLVLPNTVIIYWHSLAGGSGLEIKNNFFGGAQHPLIFNTEYYTDA